MYQEDIGSIVILNSTLYYSIHIYFMILESCDTYSQ